MIFASDNWAGAAPEILAAIAAEAARPGPAYGLDPTSARLEEAFGALFGRPVAVFPVATGTAANTLALSAYTRPGGVVFCHDGAHVRVDECGAGEFLTGGCRIVGIAGAAGKIAPAALEAAIARFPPRFVHHGQPMAVSISQITEVGAVYRPEEIAALAAVAHAHGLPLHMDGARFANAVAALGIEPADLSVSAGVDILSFGGTKNGCVAAEAVVFFDPAAAASFPFLRKRAGQLFSKQRLVAAQLAALLEDGLWLRLARHANAMAGQLAGVLTAAEGVRLAFPVDANQVFAVMPTALAERLTGAGAVFHPWDAEALGHDGVPGAGEGLYRFVTSFQTGPAEIERLAQIIDA